MNNETYKSIETGVAEALREMRREVFADIVDLEGAEKVREWLDELNEKEDVKC